MITVPVFVWIAIAAFFVVLAIEHISHIFFDELSWSQQNDFHDDEMQVRREEIAATARSQILPDSQVAGSNQTGTAPNTQSSSKLEAISSEIDGLLKYAGDKNVQLVPAQLDNDDDSVALFTFDEKAQKLIDNVAEFTVTEMQNNKDETIKQVKSLIDAYASSQKKEEAPAK